MLVRYWSRSASKYLSVLTAHLPHMHGEMSELFTIVSSICNCKPVHAWFRCTLYHWEHSLSTIHKFAYNYKSLIFKMIIMLKSEWPSFGKSFEEVAHTMAQTEDEGESSALVLSASIADALEYCDTELR